MAEPIDTVTIKVNADVTELEAAGKKGEKALKNLIREFDKLAAEGTIDVDKLDEKTKTLVHNLNDLLVVMSKVSAEDLTPELSDKIFVEVKRLKEELKDLPNVVPIDVQVVGDAIASLDEVAAKRDELDGSGAEITVSAAIKDLEEKYAESKKMVDDLDGAEAHAKVYLDGAAEAIAEAKLLSAELDGLNDEEVRIKIQTAYKRAIAEIAAVGIAVRRVGSERHNINFDTRDVDKANRKLSLLDKTLIALSKSGGGGTGGRGIARSLGVDVGGRGIRPRNIAIGAAVGLLPALGPAIPALGAAIPGVLALLTPFIGTIGTLVAGLGGLSKAIAGDEKSFKKLSPAAKQFVIIIQQLKTPLKELRQTAQGALLPGLGKGLAAAFSPAALTGATKILTVFGHVLGSVATELGGFLGSTHVVKLFTDVVTHSAPYLLTFSHIFEDLVLIFLKVTKALQPLTDEIVRVAGHLADMALVWVQLNTTAGKSKDWISTIGGGLHALGQIVGGLWQVFKGLLTVLTPVGNAALPIVVKWLNALGTWLQQNGKSIADLLVGGFQALDTVLSVVAPIIGKTIALLDRLARSTIGTKNAFLLLAGVIASLKVGQFFASWILGYRKTATEAKVAAAKVELAEARKAEVAAIAAQSIAQENVAAAAESTAAWEAEAAAVQLAKATEATRVAALTTAEAAANVEAAAVTVSAWEAASVAIRAAITAAFTTTVIGAVVAALVVATFEIIKHWDLVKKWFHDFAQYLSDKAYLLLFIPILGQFLFIAEEIYKHWDALKKFFANFANDIASIFSDNWANAILNVFVDIGLGIIHVFESAIRKIGDLLVSAFKHIPKSIFGVRVPGVGAAQSFAKTLSEVGLSDTEILKKREQQQGGIPTPPPGTASTPYGGGDGSGSGKGTKPTPFKVPTDTPYDITTAIQNADIAGDTKKQIAAHEEALKYWQGMLKRPGLTNAQKIEIRDHIASETYVLRGLRQVTPTGKFQVSNLGTGPKADKPTRVDATTRKQLLNSIRFFIKESAQAPAAYSSQLRKAGQTFLARILGDSFFSTKELDALNPKIRKWENTAIKIISTGQLSRKLDEARKQITKRFREGIIPPELYNKLIRSFDLQQSNLAKRRKSGDDLTAAEAEVSRTGLIKALGEAQPQYATGVLTEDERKRFLHRYEIYFKNLYLIPAKYRKPIEDGIKKIYKLFSTPGITEANIKANQESITKFSNQYIRVRYATKVFAETQERIKKLRKQFRDGLISEQERNEGIKKAINYQKAFKKALEDNWITEAEAKKLGVRGEKFRDFVKALNQTLKDGAQNAKDYIEALSGVVSKFQGFMPNISAATQRTTTLIGSGFSGTRPGAGVPAGTRPQPSRFNRPFQSAQPSRFNRQIQSAQLSQPSGQPSGDRSLLDRTAAAYPRLAKYLKNLAFEQSPASAGGGRKLEFYPKGESYSFDPSRMAIETFGKSAKPSDIAAELYSHAPQIDPKLARFYNNFRKSLTKRQQALLRRQYKEAKAQGETRSFAEWKKYSGLPALYRGPGQGWPKDIYTKGQLANFSNLQDYISSGIQAPQAKTPSVSPAMAQGMRADQLGGPKGGVVIEGINIQTIHTKDEMKLARQISWNLRTALAGVKHGG